MADVKPSIRQAFGDRIRVRVAALIFDDEAAPGAVLLLEHSGLYDDTPFWTPPGGAVAFGEALPEALMREVKEETGLDVRVGPLRYTLDFVRPPLHAVSFYFQCRVTGGALNTGQDPELAEQLIRRVRYLPFEELTALNLVPEGLAARLVADAPDHFPDGTRYLGTKR